MLPALVAEMKMVCSRPRTGGVAMVCIWALHAPPALTVKLLGRLTVVLSGFVITKLKIPGDALVRSSVAVMKFGFTTLMFDTATDPPDPVNARVEPGAPGLP